MSRSLQAGRVVWRHRPALAAALAVALAAAPWPARAEQWLVESSLASRLESNDNTALANTSPGTMNSLTLSSTLAASRKTENASTRLDVGANAIGQRGPGARDRVDGRIGLAQSVADPLNSVQLDAQYLQDFNDTPDAADVTVSRGRRRSTTAGAAWSRLLSERLSSNLQLSLERTAYGAPAMGAIDAVDYRNSSLSGGLSYRLSDIDTLRLDAGRSRYRTDSDSNRSDTEQLDVGWSRVVSERGSASLSLGAYRTRTQGLRSRVYCPLAISECLAGLVPLQVARERVESVGHGFQFSLSTRWRLDDSTEFALSAARRQQPSGSGVVVRNDSAEALVEHRFSATRDGSISFTESRATYQEAQGAVPRPSQRTLSVTLSQALAPDLSVQGGYRFVRAAGSAPGEAARSNSLFVSLHYDWPRLELRH